MASGGRMLLATHGFPCVNCHGNPGRAWVAAPLCQSCHTGTALRNHGQIRFDSAFETNGEVRQAVDATFGVSAGARYTTARGHGGLKCEVCHGGPHQKPHAKLPAECVSCHSAPPNTTDGGPHGIHPLGEQWVVTHGLEVEATGASFCSKCHGKDGRGTVLSRTQAERGFKTRYGEKHFLKGAQIGCYSCHADNRRPS